MLIFSNVDYSGDNVMVDGILGILPRNHDHSIKKVLGKKIS
jgi:hypothetical protein